MIGKSVPRVDAYDKVTGRAKFTDDIAPANCLVAKVYQCKDRKWYREINRYK